MNGITNSSFLKAHDTCTKSTASLFMKLVVGMSAAGHGVPCPYNTGIHLFYLLNSYGVEGWARVKL